MTFSLGQPTIFPEDPGAIPHHSRLHRFPGQQVSTVEDVIDPIGNRSKLKQNRFVGQAEDSINSLWLQNRSGRRLHYYQLGHQGRVGRNATGNIILNDKIHIGSGLYQTGRLNVRDAIGYTRKVVNHGPIGQTVHIDPRRSWIGRRRIRNTHGLLEQTRLRVQMHRGDNRQAGAPHYADIDWGRNGGVATTVGGSGSERITPHANVRLHDEIRLGISRFTHLVCAGEKLNLRYTARIQRGSEDRKVGRGKELWAISRRQDRNGRSAAIDERYALTALDAIATGVRRSKGSCRREGVTASGISHRAHDGHNSRSAIVNRCGRVERPGAPHLERLVGGATDGGRGAIHHVHSLAAAAEVPARIHGLPGPRRIEGVATVANSIGDGTHHCYNVASHLVSRRRRIEGPRAP